MRYKLTRTQVKRLIGGGYVTDGHGEKHDAGKDVKARLKEIDDNDLYGRVSIYLDTGEGAVELVWRD